MLYQISEVLTKALEDTSTTAYIMFVCRSINPKDKSSITHYYDVYSYLVIESTLLYYLCGFCFPPGRLGSALRSPDRPSNLRSMSIQWQSLACMRTHLA